MSSCSSPTASPSKPKRVELFPAPECSLDCPSPTCRGWLRFFGDPSNPTEAQFVCCSSEVAGIFPPECTAKVMISRFSSKCAQCAGTIKAKELIAADRSGNYWIHCSCFIKRTTKVFAKCQRCNIFIENEIDAEPSTCGGKDGFVHIKCSNLRKVSTPYTNDIVLSENPFRDFVVKMESLKEDTLALEPESFLSEPLPGTNELDSKPVPSSKRLKLTK
jgi:hypothetical protein